VLGTRPAHRGRRLGFVTQDHNLFPHLTWLENCSVSNQENQSADKRVIVQLAEALGVDHVLDRLPNQISRGQAQRVSLIRTLKHNPRILLLDEPSASLDRSSRDDMIKVIRGFHSDRSGLIIIASHDLDLVTQLCGPVLEVKYGSITLGR